MEVRENECQISQFDLCIHNFCEYTGKILNISCLRCHSVKFDIHYLGLPWENFFGVTTDEKERMQYAIILVLNVLVDSILNSMQLYIHVWCQGPDLNLGHIGGRRVLPLLFHLCSQFILQKPGCSNWKATGLKSKLECTIASSLNAKTAVFALFCRSPWFSSGLSVLHTKCTALWSN